MTTRRKAAAPTMKDIARKADVSIGTVSRVLNRHPDVDDGLRARVESTARKLGYQFSERTRSSVQTKSRIIALILCNDFEMSSAHSLLLLGVEEQCAQTGYYLLFARHGYVPDVGSGDAELPSVVQTPGLADCVILAGVVHEELLSKLDKHGLKYVLLRNQFVTRNENGKQRCTVEYEDERGCHEAVQYLAQLGHRDIWFIGDTSRPLHRNCCNGYARAMAELALRQHVHTIALSDDEYENGLQAAAFISEQGWPMTAIVAASTEIAAGAREGLRHHRREVPKDVSLIGFEPAPGRSRGSNLTTISVDMVEVGRQLARTAIAQIEDRERDTPPIVPASLVKRSTCRPVRKQEHMML